MTVTITNNGDGTSTYKFEVTSTNQRIMDTVEAAARYWYGVGIGNITDEDGILVDFDDLTNQQKLAIPNKATIAHHRDAARSYDANTAAEAARQAALDSAETKFIPEE